MARPYKLTDVELTVRDMLPEKEYDVKKAGIVSRIIGKPIKVQYAKHINCAEQTKNGFTITKANPKVVGISGNVAINHELAHLLFNSFDARTFKTMEVWADNIADKVYPKDAKGNTSKEHRTFRVMAHNVYRDAFNVIEDQRIESLWGKIYLGVKNDFVKTRKALGKKLDKPDPRNPTHVLLAERFFRPDLVEGSKLKDVSHYIHDVELKDRMASIIVLNKIKPHLDKLIEQIQKQGDVKKELEHEIDLTALSINSQRDLGNMENVEKLTKVKSVNVMKRDKKRNEIAKMAKGDMLNTMNDNMRGVNPYFMNDVEFASPYSKEELHSKDYEGELGRLEEDAENKVQDIKGKLSADGASKIQTSRTKIETVVKDPKKTIPEAVPINERWVSEMRRTFKAFKEKERETLSSEGYDLDISEYINMKAEGYGECLIDTEKANGLSVVLSIDGSGSMQGLKDQMIQKICGTIYKAIDGIDAVDLKCITWASDRQGNTRIRRYFNADDLRYLPSQTHGFTPTHTGIRVGSELLSTMKGKRKLLIILTDGYPNYYQGGKRVGISAVLRETIKSFKMALKRTPNILVVGVGYSNMTIRHILKNKFISCRTPEDVEKLIMKRMKKEIVRVMRK